MCKHKYIIDCPLYMAGHTGLGIGCYPVDSEQCCVEAGESDYDTELGRARAIIPHEVAQVEWNTDLRLRSEQIERNKRLNGVH